MKAIRLSHILVALLTALLLAAPAAAAVESSPIAVAAKKRGKGKKQCKRGRVPLTVNGRRRCVPMSAALPKPKAGDPRAEVVKEALTPEIAKLPDPKDKLPPPMEKVYRKLGPKALKGMEKTVGVALNRLDALAAGKAARPRLATASADSGGSFSQQFGNVTIDARLSIATVGSELVGHVEFGTTTDRGDGTTVRVATEVPLRINELGFRSGGCPTADGKVDAKDGIGITVRTEVRSNQGKTLEAFYISEVVDETEMQGIVADDAKLDSLEIRSIQRIKETAGGSAFGGSTVTGSIVRNTVVDMRTGQYDPHVSLVNVGVKLSGIVNLLAPFVRPLVAERLKKAADKDFAATVDFEIKKYRELENGWTTPNKCAKLEFGRANRSLTLKRNDSGSETVRVDARPGGSPQSATWSLTGQEHAQIGLAGGTGNPTNFDYKVLFAGDGVEVKATVRAVSKAGVAEDSWVQKTDQDAIEQIAGTFSQRTENGGSVFEAAGNATFLRFTPAIFSPPEGGYTLVDGLYTFTASGKATAIATDQCSMKGSGQFAVQKENQFSVFSQSFNEQPPYEYNFGVSSDNSSGLPMIDVELYGCSASASELEGDTFEYPAAMSVYTASPYVSTDGITFAETVVQEGTNYKVTTAWNFTGSE
jgi:hypothetical protein